MRKYDRSFRERAAEMRRIVERIRAIGCEMEERGGVVNFFRIGHNLSIPPGEIDVEISRGEEF